MPNMTEQQLTAELADGAYGRYDASRRCVELAGAARTRRAVIRS
jgi:hypothetical protein